MFNPNVKVNHRQKVLTAAQYKKLVANHHGRTKAETTADKPVVKFFWGSSTWLLSELDPETGHAFGLCDVGHGSPELGYVDLNEIVGHGMINRDKYFKPTKTMTQYADEARQAGRITA